MVYEITMPRIHNKYDQTPYMSLIFPLELTEEPAGRAYIARNLISMRERLRQICVEMEILDA